MTLPSAEMSAEHAGVSMESACGVTLIGCARRQTRSATVVRAGGGSCAHRGGRHDKRDARTEAHRNCSVGRGGVGKQCPRDEQLGRLAAEVGSEIADRSRAAAAGASLGWLRSGVVSASESVGDPGMSSICSHGWRMREAAWPPDGPHAECRRPFNFCTDEAPSAAGARARRLRGGGPNPRTDRHAPGHRQEPAPRAQPRTGARNRRATCRGSVFS